MKIFNFKLQLLTLNFVLLTILILTLLILPTPAHAATQAFTKDAPIELNFDYSREVNPQDLISKIKILLGLQKKAEHHPGKVKLIDQKGIEWHIEPGISTDEEGLEKVSIPPLKHLKPGVYKLQSEVIVDGKSIIKEQDFAWGVLALNTNKSIYLPNENAFLALAVLNEKGKMYCTAKVNLKITDPSGAVTNLSTTNNTIIINNEVCQAYEVNDKPDYFTNYQVKGAGKYQMELTAETKNGTFTINDSFEVRDSIPFDVERILATRIYPPKEYPVKLNIKANEDFEGEVVESVPSDFQISDQNVIPANAGIQLTTSSSKLDPRLRGDDGKNDTKQIIWNVSVKKGDQFSLTYSIKFPQVSPYFYLMGPLEFRKTQKNSDSQNVRDSDNQINRSSGTPSNSEFSEARQWQIASDAPSLIQKSTAVTNGGTTVAPTLAAGATANNLIVVICGNRAAGDWTPDPGGFSNAIESASTDTPGQVIYYKVAAGGETAVTCTNATSTRLGGHIYEYSGTATSSVLDTTGNNAGSGTTADSGTAVTGTSHDLLIAGMVANADTTFSSWTNSFAEENDFANGGAAASRSTYGGADRNVTATGSYSTAATIGSAAWIGQIAAFKQATITISGFAYDDEAGTPTVWGPCDHVSPVNNISLSVNGDTKQSTSCNDSTGAWSFSGQFVNAGDVITVFMDTGGGNKGVLYTKANDSTTNITGLSLTKNRVWIQSESASSVTNANINTYDQGADGDIPANSDGTNLTVDSGVEIHINTSDTFAPGGGSVTADNLHIEGTYSGSSETLTLNGSGTSTTCSDGPGTVMPLCLGGSASISFGATHTTVFKGSSDSKIDNIAYQNLTFSPTITGPVAYTGDGAITVNSNLTMNPTASTENTLTFNLGGTLTVGAQNKIITLTGTTSGKSVLDTTASGNYSITASQIDIQSAGTLTANNSTITFSTNSFDSPLFTRTGTFNAGASTVDVRTCQAVTLTSGTVTFYNLTLTPSCVGFGTYTFGSGAITINNNFTINPTASSAINLPVNMGADIIVTGTTQITRTTSATSVLNTTSANNFALTTGTLTISTGGTLTPNASTISVSGDFTRNGTFTAPTGSGTFTITGAGTSTLTGATTFKNFTSTAAGKTIKFGASTIFTFASGGVFTLTGQSGNKINLQSDSADTQWKAHFTDAQTGSTYLNVQDSGCDTGTSTITLDATSTSVSGNDTICWIFQTGVVAPQVNIQGGTEFRGGTKIGQ